MPNSNLPTVLLITLARVKKLCNCVNSQILEGYPGAGGMNGKGVVNLLCIELSPTNVAATFELARCHVEKVGRGQRLCNCVKSNF